MITSITKANDQKYRALFDKAELALKEERGMDVTINSLNLYFQHIVELANTDLTYTILPVDEELFEINANTREIIIPKSFKNGVGVQGDQVAEIIYFKIDRYFDNIDLNTQNIYIEWENADQIGLSGEYVRDIASDPDHIIFGWPLTNKITSSAGKVKFAVRFYSFNSDNDIIYSFATQPAEIVINKTMAFAIEDASIDTMNTDEVRQLVLGRLQNSFADENGGDVDAPIFTEDLNDSIAEYDIENADIEGKDDTSSFAIAVQAFAGAASISYTLCTHDKNTDNYKPVLTIDDKLKTKIKFLPTDDSHPEEDKIYYTRQKPSEKEEYVYTQYLPSQEEQEDGFAAGLELYERFGMCYIAAAGDYAVKATATINTASKSTYSKTITFPAATPVELIGTNAIILNGNDTDGWSKELNPVYADGSNVIKGQKSYAWTRKGVNETISTDEKLLVTEPGYYCLQITNQRNKDSKVSNISEYRVTYPARMPGYSMNNQENMAVGQTLTIIVNSKEMPYDTITAKWYKDTATGADLIAETEINAEGIIGYTPTSMGSYWADITVTLNGDTASQSTVDTGNKWTVVL